MVNQIKINQWTRMIYIYIYLEDSELRHPNIKLYILKAAMATKVSIKTINRRL